jgi:hypothetical protein
VARLVATAGCRAQLLLCERHLQCTAAKAECRKPCNAPKAVHKAATATLTVGNPQTTSSAPG